MTRWGGGFLLAKVFRAGYVPKFLKGPMMLSMVFLVYGLANVTQEEAGLLATTVFGIVIGNARLPSIDEIRRFKESIAILLVSGVFILLTIDLDPRVLAELDWSSVVLILAVLCVVHPFFAAPWRPPLASAGGINSDRRPPRARSGGCLLRRSLSLFIDQMVD